MEKDIVYLAWSYATHEFYIVVGTGEKSLTTDGWWRFEDEDVYNGKYKATILHPSEVVKIGKL